jgi:survival-of-motor-neuron-related-splicing factor 30
VEAALTNDPTNEELLKLKEDLTEVIQLSRDLLQLVPEVHEGGCVPTAFLDSVSLQAAPTAGPALVYNWKPGDSCSAVWSESGKYFNAVIDMISEDNGTCSVTFEGYGTTEIVKLSELRPETSADEGGRKRKGAQLMKAKATKQRREQLKEYRKKKTQKKLQKQQEVEVLREKEKDRWKSFTQKSSRQKGPLNSKQKRSIFAVPDSLSGRVGVGTCNVGGKGMTDFETRKKYSKS